MKIFTCFIIVCALAGCSNRLNSHMKGGFDRQGHRGCRGLMPENTIAAMLNAVRLGVTTLEMDVVVTGDNQIVVSHEPFFNHEITTKPDGTFVTEAEEKSLNIYKMSYDQVKQFDVGLKPHPRFLQQQKIAAIKPLLKTLIDSVEHYCHINKLKPVQYNIETKTNKSTDLLFHPDPAAMVALLLDVIKEKHLKNRVVIQSFDVRTLQRLHITDKSIKTALLVEMQAGKSLDDQLKELGFTPDIYSPEYHMVSKELVNECHNKNIKIIPWTVNDLEMINRLKALPVDGIITDYPNLF